MHVSKTERLKVNLAAKAARLGISRDVDNWYPHLLLDTVIDRSGVGSIFSSIANQTKVVFNLKLELPLYNLFLRIKKFILK